MERRRRSAENDNENAANNLTLLQMLADICSQLTAVFQQVVIYAIPILGSMLLVAFFFSLLSPPQLNSLWPTMAAILTNCCAFDRLLESALIKLLQSDRILPERPGNAGNYFRLCKKINIKFFLPEEGCFFKSNPENVTNKTVMLITLINN